ncbi:MAG: nitroreductase family protein [Fibrobacterota bacterium]|nr:nitroreductase family protein [Fibrobacterota bacterium]QQS03792.1 MAG: nitroreductase family protein [Fibrobacterota bacterium]
MKLPGWLSVALKESPVVLGSRLVVELFDEWRQLTFQLGAARCTRTRDKWQAKLTVEFHAIEKGLSLGAPRLGFGEKRILELISDLRTYRDRFDDPEFLAHPLATIRGYLAYNADRGFDPVKVREAFERLESEQPRPTPTSTEGGVKLVRKSDLTSSGLDFEAFAMTRHSVRDFSSRQVTREELLQAVATAQRAPSACNRQAWHAHIFQASAKDEILRFQGGSNGFVESVGAAVVVVGDLRSYFINEIHQPYVDGSLFAMTMMFAFHGQGMGSIPLTTSFKRRRLREFRRRFGIPEHQVPVMILGVGHLKDEFHVAISARRDVSESVTFHDGASKQ